MSMLFPPNSGDINPIETVWARLRKDLAIQEFEDLKNDKVITVASFRKRVAQLLRSYSTPGAPFFFHFHPYSFCVYSFRSGLYRHIYSYSYSQFVLECSQGPGEQYSYLERLVRGIPKRLAKCKKNNYGPCGK